MRSERAQNDLGATAGRRYRNGRPEELRRPSVRSLIENQPMCSTAIRIEPVDGAVGARLLGAEDRGLDTISALQSRSSMCGVQEVFPSPLQSASVPRARLRPDAIKAIENYMYTHNPSQLVLNTLGVFVELTPSCTPAPFESKTITPGCY